MAKKMGPFEAVMAEHMAKGKLKPGKPGKKAPAKSAKGKEKDKC